MARLGPLFRVSPGCSQGVSRAVVCTGTREPLLSPFRLLAEFSSLQWEKQAPAFLLAVSCDLSQLPQAAFRTLPCGCLHRQSQDGSRRSSLHSAREESTQHDLSQAVLFQHPHSATLAQGQRVVPSVYAGPQGSEGLLGTLPTIEEKSNIFRVPATHTLFYSLFIF